MPANVVEQLQPKDAGSTTAVVEVILVQVRNETPHLLSFRNMLKISR